MGSIEAIIPVAAAVLLCAAGCSSATDSGGWSVPVLDHEIPPSTAANSMPFDAYHLPEADLVALQQKQVQLLTECGHRYGATLSFGGDYIRPTDDSRSFWGGRPGTLSKEHASVYGYHAAPDSTWAPVGGFYVRDATNVQYAQPDNSSVEEGATAFAVVYGPSTETNSPQSTLDQLPTDASGDPVPEGGCWKEVEERIDSPLQTDVELAADLVNLALVHPDVKSATKRWSKCMAAQGFQYDEPYLASESFSLSILTPKETDTAVADVECTQQSRWADTFYAVLAAYQTQAIVKYSSTLEGVLASEKTRLNALNAEE